MLGDDEIPDFGSQQVLECEGTEYVAIDGARM